MLTNVIQLRVYTCSCPNVLKLVHTSVLLHMCASRYLPSLGASGTSMICTIIQCSTAEIIIIGVLIGGEVDQRDKEPPCLPIPQHLFGKMLAMSLLKEILWLLGSGGSILARVSNHLPIPALPRSKIERVRKFNLSSSFRNIGPCSKRYHYPTPNFIVRDTTSSTVLYLRAVIWSRALVKIRQHMIKYN